jgi:phosphate transport system substrate-binding protein
MFEYKGIISAFALLSISFTSLADTAELTLVSCHVSKDAYVTDLVTAYQKESGVHIEVRDGNSTSAIRDVHIGVADIGGTSRDLVPGETHQTDVELLPVAWDALAIIVHKDNPVDNISLDQVKAIYTGRIRYWTELGGTDQKIEVYAHKNKISGNGRTLRELLFSNTDKTLYTSRVFDYGEQLEQAVIQNPNAIAITGVSSAHTQDVKIVALDGMKPSIENIKTGNYSLYRPLFLTYDPHSPNIESIQDFIRFVLSQSGRDVMYANGVVPYREAMSLVMKKARDNDTSYPQVVGKI